MQLRVQAFPPVTVLHPALSMGGIRGIRSRGVFRFSCAFESKEGQMTNPFLLL